MALVIKDVGMAQLINALNKWIKTMKINFTQSFFTCLLLTFSTVLLAANDAKTAKLENSMNDTQLISELRHGGYILYFRHGKTNHNTFDSDRDNLKNYSAQRLLSQEGCKEMSWIGNTIRQLDIKIGSDVSSSYCRSIDTATRAFNRTDINPDLKHTVTVNEATIIILT
jgi:hypothetical protein